MNVNPKKQNFPILIVYFLVYQIRGYAEKMLGNRLVTKQTLADGQLVSKVLVHEGVSFKKELYFAIVLVCFLFIKLFEILFRFLIVCFPFIDFFHFVIVVQDRSQGGPCMVASPMGGMDIEEVAEKHPDKIFLQPIDIMKGVLPEQTARIATLLGFTAGTPAFADVQVQVR